MGMAAKKGTKYALSIVLAVLLSLCIGFVAPNLKQETHLQTKAQMPSFQIEYRYLENQNALLCTEQFILKVLNENEVHGPRREFQTEFTIDNIAMQLGYDFVSAVRQKVGSPEKINFALVPNKIGAVLELKIGDENFLTPGDYQYSLQYKIINPIFADGDQERSIILMTPLPAIAVDSFVAAFYPPELVEPKSITATAFILAEERDGEYSRIQRTSDFNMQASASTQEKNRFGEGKPVIPVRIPRSLNGNEYLWLDVHWPKGFVIKTSPQ